MNYQLYFLYALFTADIILSQNVGTREMQSNIRANKKHNHFNRAKKSGSLSKASKGSTTLNTEEEIDYFKSSVASTQNPIRAATKTTKKPISSGSFVSKSTLDKRTTATKAGNTIKSGSPKFSDDDEVAIEHRSISTPTKTIHSVSSQSAFARTKLALKSAVVASKKDLIESSDSSSTDSPTQSTSLDRTSNDVVISKDFTCGIQHGSTVCGSDNPFGACCSQYGYCGSTPEYCSSINNCQSGCKETNVTNTSIYSRTDRCGSSNNGLLCDPFGPYGPCCSVSGYCGITTDYCLPSSGCQSGCLVDTPKYSDVETCGTANNGLMCDPNGDYGPCCSSSGRCGSGDSYCKPDKGCQSGCEIVSEKPLSTCGDGFCDKRGETCFSCPSDCGACDLSYVDNCVGKGHISLTIDDGPSEFSDNLLKVSSKLGVKLTHFIIGQKLATPSYQTFLKNFYNAGHAIASHTFTHPFMTHLTDQQLRTEMLMTDHAIYSIIGAHPIYMRNPYSDTNTRTMALLQSMGYQSIFTSLDTQDTVYGDLNPSMIPQIVNSKLNSSSSSANSFVLTQHETYNSSINYLPDIVTAIKSKGYDMPLIDSCLGQPGIYRNDTCGNGVCTGWVETCKTCPTDCGVCP